MLVTVIAAVAAEVVGAPTNSYLAYREKVAAEVGAARMKDQTELNKKYAAEVNARLVKLVGTVKVKGFSATAGSNVQGVVPGDVEVSLLVATVPLLKVWAKRADVGLKSTDDVAVIFVNETFYTDVFDDDAATCRFAELLVKRKPADAVVKALLLWDAGGAEYVGRFRQVRGEGLCPLAGGEGAGECRLWGE
ncbi:hypothetical protein [Burkholderia sp. BCC1999]|uniref:hypothetical protein n=1 Tax=Burkholderia sp. BCC1999 TaxID=2817448 RepID=UPI002AC31CEC|nr:hypothetical protein [Burkholderia sp. BCC1999]